MSAPSAAHSAAASPASAVEFTALIPARLGSSRLPDKPLADIGGLPMVVRVARRAAASGARRVVVCADSARILDACRQHGVEAILTDDRHPTGTDRLAQACRLLGLDAQALVVNVQGDEPLIPPSVIRAVAAALADDPHSDIATAAHALSDAREFFDPNVVKVVRDARGRALLFSRAPIPWARDAFAAEGAPRQTLRRRFRLRCQRNCRRCGMWACTPTGLPICCGFPICPARPSRSSKASSSCGPSTTAMPSR